MVGHVVSLNYFFIWPPFENKTLNKTAFGAIFSLCFPKMFFLIFTVMDVVPPTHSVTVTAGRGPASSLSAAEHGHKGKHWLSAYM